MNVAQETLGLRRAGLSPALSLLMSAFALPIPPATLSSHLQRPTERSPTTPGNRGQGTGNKLSRRRYITRSASSRFARIHRANAATSLRLYTLDRGSSESTPASHQRS